MADITVKNPRTGEVLYSMDEPTQQDVAKAYQNANEAFQTLRAMSLQERLREVAKLKDYLLKNKDHVAGRIVQETGKNPTEALAMEVFPTLDMMAYYEKNAAKFLGDQVVKTPIVLMGKKSRVYYEPLGTVLVISPWNYPFQLSFIPVITAMIAGNAVILKPSKFTPLKGVIEDMINQSGFLKNAIQVLYASRRTAAALIDARPAKIMFTGSVAVGKQVMAQAAQYLIPVELELGGKDPMVIFDDVNLDRTVNGTLWGGFSNCGQTCTSVERVYVQEGIYDAFVAALKEKVLRVRTLKGQDVGTANKDFDIGCMTTDFQLETIESQLADAVAKGAKIISGGKRVEGTHIFPPTVVTDLDNSMALATNETFGPVINVTKFKTEDEAVRLANDSPFGLSASVWSGDLERAQRVARKIVTGNVSINNVLATQANAALPFGGIKDSGFGRYHGPQGLHSFSNIKSILIDKQSGKVEMYWFPYSKKKYAMIGQLMDAFFGGGALSLLKTALIGLKLELLARKERL